MFNNREVLLDRALPTVDRIQSIPQAVKLLCRRHRLLLRTRSGMRVVDGKNFLLTVTEPTGRDEQPGSGWRAFSSGDAVCNDWKWLGGRVGGEGLDGFPDPRGPPAGDKVALHFVPENQKTGPALDGDANQLGDADGVQMVASLLLDEEPL
ncbi:hypothetical protein NPIL_57381 [Nephila pilipes]|uniref:Uncharacterized protein n=1 Tax=Nephila pilipes TaxID=299642 RepID=A0A8X6QMU6_NEPPI|nr:hypothetical protein NPIL_57381 [Nephila pilipes]